MKGSSETSSIVIFYIHVQCLLYMYVLCYKRFLACTCTVFTHRKFCPTYIYCSFDNYRSLQIIWFRQRFTTLWFSVCRLSSCKSERSICGLAWSVEKRPVSAWAFSAGVAVNSVNTVMPLRTPSLFSIVTWHVSRDALSLWAVEPVIRSLLLVREKISFNFKEKIEAEKSDWRVNWIEYNCNSGNLLNLGIFISMIKKFRSSI